MVPRSWILGVGGLAVVGAAVGGGYYAGHSTGPVSAPPSGSQAQNQPSQAAPPSGMQASETQAPAPSSTNSSSGTYQTAYEPWREDNTSHVQRRPRHIGFAYFRDELAPYGEWSYSDRWGEVWQPNRVDADFRPYERGRWRDTREFGWTWVSDESWGDIPFHYGRWVDDPDRGWLWIPGYVWGPGWVVWRSGGGHTGWMPMPPDNDFLRGNGGEQHDWSAAAQSDYGYRDWYGPNYDRRRMDAQWTYVDTGHIDDPDWHRYEDRRANSIEQLNAQTQNVTNYSVENGYVVNRSVDPRWVEQRSGHQVQSLPAQDVIQKPELVVPAAAGRQVAVTTHETIPIGNGRPNSAAPPSPAALNAPAPTTTGARPNGAQPNVTPPNGAAQNGAPVNNANPWNRNAPGNPNPTAQGSATAPASNNRVERHPEGLTNSGHPIAPNGSASVTTNTNTSINTGTNTNTHASSAPQQPAVTQAAPSVTQQPGSAPTGSIDQRQRRDRNPWVGNAAPNGAQTQTPPTANDTRHDRNPLVGNGAPVGAQAQAPSTTNDTRRDRRPFAGNEVPGAPQNQTPATANTAPTPGAQQHTQPKAAVVPSALPPGQQSPFAHPAANAQPNAASTPNTPPDNEKKRDKHKRDEPGGAPQNQQ